MMFYFHAQMSNLPSSIVPTPFICIVHFDFEKKSFTKKCFFDFLKGLLFGCHDTQHNDIQHNNTQHKGLFYDT